MTPADRTSATRERIVEAACRTIAAVGFERVRMRMVAEAAGVSTALLHYHFENRDRLFLEALRHSFLTAGMAEFGQATGPDRTALWRLARLVDVCLPITEELRVDQLLWQELWLRAARDDASRKITLEFYRSMQDWAEEIIKDGIVRGEFVDCDVARVAGLVLALTDGFGVRLVLDDPELGVDSVRETIWRALGRELGFDTPFPAVGRS